MEATIYIDVVFFINFCMDILILWMTAVLCKKKCSKGQIVLGGFFLSFCYCLGIVMPALSFLCHGLGGMALLSIGIFLLYRPKRLKTFLQYLFVAVASAFAIGGVALFLFFATGLEAVGTGMAFTVEQFPLKILLGTSCFFYILIKLGNRWFCANVLQRKNYCTMEFQTEQKKFSLQMLIDTGNHLKDPFTGNDVAIVAFPAIKELFSKEVQYYFFREYENQQKFYEYALKQEKQLSLHFVPFSSLGKENGLLLVFQPKQVIFYEKTEKQENHNISLGIYCGSFDGGYDGLVSPEMLIE